MKQKYFIDSNKVATAFVMLLLMAVYDQWQNPTAWIYLALHGGYGFMWFLKSRIFPDAAWEEKASLAYGLVIWVGLSLYWVAGWIVMARGVQAPAWYLGLCVGLYIFGVFAHFASDMQKHVRLQLQPGELITDGMFSRLRNPNYFGELLIYAGFGLLAIHWLPIAILLVWIVAIWFPRMRKKDRALAELQGFDTYRERTKLFIPFLF